MGTRVRRTVLAVLFACGWIGISATTAMAGIPEPGIVMYGQVLEDAGGLVTEGDLTVDYVPAGAGVALSITTPLSRIEGPGGPYSYRLVVPLETELADYPVSAGALALADGPLAYTRTMSVPGASISVSHEITLSPDDRGTAQRADVCTTCPALVRVRHAADVNADYAFSLSEFLRVYELHSATATHEYHVDPTTEDGYGPGPGPQDGLPHSADYLGGADWHIEMSEVLRMVDLFTSTEDHSYSPYPAGDDGFQKGHGDLVLSRASGATELLARVDAPVDAGAEGAVPVSVTVESRVHAAPSALGVRIALPAGWSYAGQEDSRAFIRPNVLDEGVLEFGWSGTAQLPLTFTFNIASPEGQLGASDIISAQAAYRVKSGRDERLSPVGRLRLSAPSDAFTSERIQTAAARDRVVATTSPRPVTRKPRRPSTRERVLILGRERPSTMPEDSTSRAIRARPSSAVRERVVDHVQPLEEGATVAATTGAEPVPAQGPWLRITLVLAILGIGAHLCRPSVRGAGAYRDGSQTK